MKILSADFITSATKPSQYPPAGSPEIAFAGRSNVGKSSLINALVNRKHLVKTSSTPGRTQLLNFFEINGNISFVDLPGYGYAKVPASVRKKWGPMIETFLSTRTTLKGVVLIMDIRRIPRQEELDLMHWLNSYAIPIIAVLTKSDKLSKTKQFKQQSTVAKYLDMDPKELILFSTKSRQGKEIVWKAILALTKVNPK